MKYLRMYDDMTDITRIYLFCPACREIHMIDDDLWGIKTNLFGITVSPSILVEGGPNGVVCHSILENDVWRFLSESTHSFRGTALPAINIPINIPKVPINKPKVPW